MPSQTSSPHPEDLYDKVIRTMKTFVCEGCYDEELREHPELGDDWTPEWYRAMAQLAKEQGWLIVPADAERETWFFPEFRVIGPRCAAHGPNAG